MKKIFVVIAIVCFIGNFLSCSMTFEKRRYRPGYHISSVKNHHKTHQVNDNEVIGLVKKDPSAPVLIDPEINNSVPVLLPVDQVLKTKGKEEIHTQQKLKHKIQTKDKFDISSFFKRKKLLKTSETKAPNKTGLILGLTFGGAALAFTIAGIVMLVQGGFGGLAVGLILMIVAAILIVFALVFGLIKWRTPGEPKPVSSGFINGSFIFSIITLSLALISFLFSFFIYPFGLVSMIISGITMAASVVAFSLGFRALKSDKSLKTKLTIIFAFIALIFAILAMILIFI